MLRPELGGTPVLVLSGLIAEKLPTRPESPIGKGIPPGVACGFRPVSHPVVAGTLDGDGESWRFACSGSLSPPNKPKPRAKGRADADVLESPRERNGDGRLPTAGLAARFQRLCIELELPPYGVWPRGEFLGEFSFEVALESPRLRRLSHRIDRPFSLSMLR
mmetsp:Transcript_36430/g.56475  ORF Transcript_36430/g.56475 Transcript_36430/m.56475 type:complete len:162 (+) Transcript_36430:278-763(+)